MTTEEKNKVLELYRQGIGKREISKLLKISSTTVFDLISKEEEIICFATCPCCGKEITIKKSNGRPQKFCSASCRIKYNDSIKPKSKVCVCKCCGKEFMDYSFHKPMFCSRQCARDFRYGNKGI